MFAGVRLDHPAHYAVSFSLPPGTYEVFGVQGLFPDHRLGTLTVPGTFLVKPPDPQMIQGTADWPWDEPAPPLKVEPAALAVPEEPAPAPVWLVGLVVAAAAGLFVVLRKRLRPFARR